MHSNFNYVVGHYKWKVLENLDFFHLPSDTLDFCSIRELLWLCPQNPHVSLLQWAAAEISTQFFHLFSSCFQLVLCHFSSTGATQVLCKDLSKMCIQILDSTSVHPYLSNCSGNSKLYSLRLQLNSIMIFWLGFLASRTMWISHR